MSCLVVQVLRGVGPLGPKSRRRVRSVRTIGDELRMIGGGGPSGWSAISEARISNSMSLACQPRNWYPAQLSATLRCRSLCRPPLDVVAHHLPDKTDGDEVNVAGLDRGGFDECVQAVRV